MRNFSLFFASLLLCASFFVTTPSLARNNNNSIVQSNTIQMLPPVSEASMFSANPSPCTGSNNFLAWNGVNPINCVSTLTADNSGNLTLGSGTTTVAINSPLTVNSTMTATSYDVPGSTGPLGLQKLNMINNLYAETCGLNEVLTKGTNNTFGCASVLDVSQMGGSQMVPTCAAGSYLTYDGSTFSCTPPQVTPCSTSYPFLVADPITGTLKCDSNFVADGSGNVTIHGSISITGAGGITMNNGMINLVNGGIITNDWSSFNAPVNFNSGTNWNDTSINTHSFIQPGGQGGMFGDWAIVFTPQTASFGSGGGTISFDTASGSGRFNGYVSLNGGYGGPSDRRLKKDIEPITGALDIVDKLQGVHFNWRNPSEREIGKEMILPVDQHQIGFIAQDVQLLVPEAVHKNEKTGTFELQEAKIVPMLVEAMKEQQAEIEALKTEIATMKGQ